MRSDEMVALAAELERGREQYRGATAHLDGLLTRAASALRDAAAREQAMREAIAAEVEDYAERLKHTSHRDGLGMGWQEGEHLCREIANHLRATPAILDAARSPSREDATP